MSARSLGFQFFRFTVAAIFAVVLIAVAAVFAVFPGGHAGAAPAAVSADETARTLAALKPPKRARHPVVAVVGANEGSETTDYLIPYGVLKRSGVADVVSLGVSAGPVTLMPALNIVPEATIAEFDRRFPDGADYVIVPALHNAHNPALIAWIKAQSAKGATIVGICAGALVLSNAGLLDGRSATTIWSEVEGLRKKHPTMRYIPDRRYVADRGVVTTTGVSASLPVSLAIVEAIAGHERADALAREIGAPGWSVAHASSAFHVARSDIWAMLQVWSSLRRHETVGIPVSSGVDEVSIALIADAYATTNLTRVIALGDGTAPIVTAQGIRLVPDGVRGKTPVDLILGDVVRDKPVRAMDRAFGDIAERYGRDYASLARLSLEYPEAEASGIMAARE